MRKTGDMIDIRKSFSVSVVVFSVFSAGIAFGAEVVPLPGDVSESGTPLYSVKAGGVEIPLSRVGAPGGRDNEVYYARFTGVDRAEVSVFVSVERSIEAEVLPARAVRDLDVKGSTIAFMVEGPGPRIVRPTMDGKELPRLIVILEPEEERVPDAAVDTVFNVLDYGVAEGPETQTEKIQKALDECTASPDGGFVVVPAGRYTTGTLRIHDNTILYLAPGATLVASSNPDDFPVDPGRKEEGTHGRTHSFSRVIIFDNATNAGIMGRGAIDGNGPVLRNEKHRAAQIIDAHDSTNILIEGIVLRNPASWTCHLVASTNVRVRNLKIITDWDVGNADGIDPDMCQNVLMENVFCYTGDDSIAVKATHVSDYLRPCMNITIRDSVVMTYKTALKIGTETYADVRNVLFENIDVVHSSRGCALWVRDGGHVSNVVYRDIRMDLVEIPPEGRSGQPFYLYMEKRYGEGSRLSDVLFQNITCRAPWYSFIDSRDPTPIERVTFENVELTVLPRERKKDKKYLFEFHKARNIDFVNLTVDWTEAKPDQWKGLWADDAPVHATDVVKRGGRP